MNPSPVDLYLARAGHRAATEEGRERGSDKRKRWSDVRSNGWMDKGRRLRFVCRYLEYRVTHCWPASKRRLRNNPILTGRENNLLPLSRVTVLAMA